MSYKKSKGRFIMEMRRYIVSNPVGVMRRLPYMIFRRPGVRMGWFKGDYAKYKEDFLANNKIAEQNLL